MNYPAIKQQSGSVLAISLVLLTAITIIAAMSMQRAGLQTRITGNILHREELFNSALNEQESWFFQLKNADTGDAMLSEPMRTFNLDANGSKTYLPVELDLNNGLPKFAQVESELLLAAPPEGSNALSQGEEVGDRVQVRYELESVASFDNRIEGRSMTETQITGMSFPGLNTSKNSLYSAP
jgi:hypothetical protein